MAGKRDALDRLQAEAEKVQDQDAEVPSQVAQLSNR